MLDIRVKNISCLLLSLIAILLLTTCDHQQADHFSDYTHLNASGKMEYYQETGLTKYDPPIQLHLVRETSQNLEELLSHLPGETLEDNRWSKLYEEVLGIKISYNWKIEGDLYYRKLGSDLASGKLPDMVMVNTQQLRQLNNAGLIQDLSEAYERFATPLTKEVLNEEGTGPIESATLDGKLMAIPVTESTMERAEFLWVRTDWLDHLGLEAPKTMADVLDISEAFTAGDPNQNGENDTVGLAITQYIWDPAMGLTGFMAGYGAYPTIWIENEASELEFGGIQPEVKLALKALQDMYRKGQLDSEFFLKDGNKVKNDIRDGKVGMLYGEQWSSFIAGTSRTKDRNSQWQAFPIVANSDSIAKVPLKRDHNKFLVVRKDFEHPEAVIKLINLHLEKNWGKTANYATYYSNPYPVWQLSPVTPFPTKKNIEAYDQLKRARATGDFSQLTSEAGAIHMSITNYLTNGDEAGWGWEKTYGPEGAFAILDDYMRNDQLVYDPFSGSPTDTMVKMKPILDDFMHDTFVNIILGHPIDEFDAFVKKWNELGGIQMTEEVNQWYSEKRAKMKEDTLK